MKFTSTIILFLALASLTAATSLDKPGNRVDLKCEGSTASSTGEFVSEWTSTNVYDVQVCVASTVAVKECSPAGKSSLALTVVLKDMSVVPITPKEFGLDDLTAKKSFCHIFELCDFLPQLAGKDLTGSKIKAEAILGFQPEAAGAAKFEVSMQATSFVVDKAEVKPVGSNIEPFSVVCNNFACDVAADNVSKVSTETLTVVDGQAPQCETATKADQDAKKLYVSVFKCEGDKCPENFTVTAAASTSSSSTPEPETSEPKTSEPKTPEPETSETQPDNSSSLRITGMAGAFIATILSLIV